MIDIHKLITDIAYLNSISKFRLEFDATGGFVEFYNTSGKAFVIGLKSIKAIVEDIAQHLPVFSQLSRYDEKPWRDVGGTYYTDNVANAMSTVQTKPLFATVSKFIAIANCEIQTYSDDKIDVDPSKLQGTQQYLEELIGLFRIDLGKDTPDFPADPAELKRQFANWLVNRSKNNYFNNDSVKAEEAVTQYNEKYKEVFQADIFNVDFENLDAFIEKVRENIYNEESEFWKYSKSVSNHQPKAIFGKKNYLTFLKEHGSSPISGYNKIYFGAPGTGKSYKVAQALKGIPEDQIERVTFHPDYDYASFVGGYKPVTEHDQQGNQNVQYRFVPQVFTNIYERAHRNPMKNYYLVIEEINRGNCAEIFGDVFQLLDRNPDYAITPSEDLLVYLRKRDEQETHKSLERGKMVMPDNLIILATMNTSDQSLFPMDSAFKRRWEWEYVPIKYPTDAGDTSCPSFSYRVELGGEHYFNWIAFVAEVNRHIIDNPSLGLDKCIGNFFVKPEPGTSVLSVATIINKVIFYLWNDVFKDEENDVFANHNYLDYFPIESKGEERLRLLAEKLGVLEEKLLASPAPDEEASVVYAQPADEN